MLDEPRFRRTNPGYREGQPCVYVGMTGLDPDLRFDKRYWPASGYNRFAQRYGLRLLPDLYVGLEPHAR